MGAALNESIKSLEDLELDSAEDLEAFQKLVLLERDLLELKNILTEVKKVKKCCEVKNELQEINASRKK